MIYMLVVIQTQPWRTMILIKCQDIIHRAYSSFLELYDEMFRMRAALDPTIH